MSWMKRRGHPPVNNTGAPPIRMYNPNQHSNQPQPYQQAQWQQPSPVQNDQNNWYGNPMQKSDVSVTNQTNTSNYWQQPQQQQQQQQQPYVDQNYSQQHQVAPQYNQYNQNPYQNYYQNQAQNHVKIEQPYQQGYYSSNQPNQQQQSYTQNQTSNVQQGEDNAESDPWNWGWEDNNLNQGNTVQNNQNMQDNFTNDESWNWSVQEDTSNPTNPIQNSEFATQENHPPINSETNKKPMNTISNQVAGNLTNDVDNNALQSQEVLDHFPKHVSVSRIKNENLTPQWSIESQVSQDSSDDVLLTSESDNKSNILSRSSTISHSPSRPSSTHENVEPVVQHKPLENPKRLVDEILQEIKQEEDDFNNVHKYMKGLSIQNQNTQFENNEIVSPENVVPVRQSETPLTHPEANYQKQVTKQPENTLPPPPNFKRTSSNTSINSLRYSRESLTPSSIDNFAGSQKIRQDNNMGVNLETLPDNSERPDQVEHILKAPKKVLNTQKQWAENCEIATTINDRNQYLETGQLSDIDIPYGDSASAPSGGLGDGDSLPPPGFKRLVLGQIEQTETSQTNDNVEEPPPGLSRMVLGRTETETSLNQSDTTEFRNEEPPVGLHRMVPGESSSPESSSYSRYQTDSTNIYPQNYDDDNYVSESELNQVGALTMAHRSATIGADTPPAVNQQIVTTGAYSTSSSVDPTTSRVGAVGIDNEQRDTDVDGANTLDESIPGSVSSLPPDTNRRDDIDGGPQYDSRNQMIPQNISDIPISNNQHNQDKARKTKSYTTDSDHERQERHRSLSPSRYEKDPRYYDDKRKDRDRDRDSPEYRDRKYDRRSYDRRDDRKEERRERYDDDTDHYSDKEKSDRRRKENIDDYERRYSSLRRDRDRDRDKRRREFGRDDRDRRNDYYYRHEEDYYRDVNRSRPSSRSDSVNDSYRERMYRDRGHDGERDRDRDMDRSLRHRDRDRDRDRDKDHRRHRDPYNQYYQSYNYDPYNPYYAQHYQQYQYYENLRRTNPQAYAEWYRKYYQTQGAAAGYNTDDRASVHSGRSSANGDLSKERFARQSYHSQQSYSNYYREIQNASTIYTVDDSRLMDNTDSSLNLEDSTVATQRLTPAKFSTAHIKGSIASGYLVNILPHYPLDGQSATVQLININDLIIDSEEVRELSEFPGPLVKGITHKKTLIDYCENKIRRANPSMQDFESYVLMWELLILLLRQNGMVVGTDIAELLMKNRKFDDVQASSALSTSSLNSDNEQPSSLSQYSDKYLTDKFREYLIYGSDKEALEWAMKHGLWGHALFLASKLDKRTYASVMMRFANGLTINDPLQTLYQLLSGKQPASVTCVADEKWGDWRPHLAMILSNTTQHPELYRKAITTLGDTLFSRGSLYAAQFCYLMAQVEFSRYGAPNAKLVLLGSSHHQSLNMFATNEAIFMTEIYEYACSLSDASYSLPEFLMFKYLVATRMADYGLLEKSLQYCERIADGILQNRSRVDLQFISQVYNLADRLKYHDPLLTDDGSETTWLYSLKIFYNEFNSGLISTQNNLLPEDDQSNDNRIMNENYQMSGQQWAMDQQSSENYMQNNESYIDYSQQPLVNQTYDTVQKQENNFQPEQPYWNQTQDQQNTWNESQNTNLSADEPQQTSYWDNQQSQDISQPQISLPNQSKQSFFDEEDTPAEKKTAAQPKPVVKSTPIAPAKPASTGWFGGIWNKLSLRPKNQMILPDDKNPTIVWDSEKKRWVNLDEDGDEASRELKPPPKMSDILQNKMGNVNNQPNNSLGNINANKPPLPPMPMTMPEQKPVELMQTNSLSDSNTDLSSGPKPPGQTNNMFKLGSRGRNIKKSYVDVFNPGGVKSTSDNVPPAAEVFGAIPSVGSQMNYFVPAPMTDNSNAPVDFLSQVPAPSEDSTNQVAGGPQMYNPNQFSQMGRGGNH